MNFTIHQIRVDSWSMMDKFKIMIGLEQGDTLYFNLKLEKEIHIVKK